MELTSENRSGQRTRASYLLWLVGLLGVALALAGASIAQAKHRDKKQNYCSATARLQLQACRAETWDDSASAAAICLNESDAADRAECSADAQEARDEQAQGCEDSYDSRIELCGEFGESRYDPDFDEANFVSDFVNPGVQSPYLPLTIGNTWDFASNGGEETHIEVLSDTKLIDDVTCLVVRDQVSEDGELKEDTDDWIALALNGDLWYCGEEVKDYERFDGDQPMNPELVAIDGSFKVGRDGDKPGVLVPANPTQGLFYRQEYSIGNAEDVAEVLATDYVYGNDPELDQGVPKALADHLCGAGCFVTREYTPIEPDVFERKYTAPGIGVFLETNLDTGEVNRLVGCNYDARCATLPQP
jgi:hypothetical protein